MENTENHKLIMYYTEDEKKSNQIAGLCKRLGIRTRKIKPSDINLGMGSLAGIKTGVVKKEKNRAPIGYDIPEVIVFSGISDKNLDIFLQEYKKEKITQVALKAILTPYNISWTLYELIAELQRERMEMLFNL